MCFTLLTPYIFFLQNPYNCLESHGFLPSQIINGRISDDIDELKDRTNSSNQFSSPFSGQVIAHCICVMCKGVKIAMPWRIIDETSHRSVGKTVSKVSICDVHMWLRSTEA
ncbi:hypothetical protein AVEN_15906-1 [Araneus ventricosus]|uniref:Uncharacterized protein n=1 Tax=Araneus ventricosus TaxID=182803 RepID=A0A4Y2UPK7_ARAVE|nr:hypothetical protein AVEN_15906-1 [Araneus ventricosus]